MREEWRDITDYEGIYQVSNLGRVKRFYQNGNQKILKNTFNGNYLQVRLSKNGIGKTYLIHILVANEFIPNPKNKPQVNHKNGNKLQNIVDLDDLYGETTNLEWATSSENNSHAYKTGLHPKYFGIQHARAKKVNQYNLQGNFIKTWDCIMDVERELKIFNTNICACCKNKKKTAGGFIWRYADADN